MLKNGGKFEISFKNNPNAYFITFSGKKTVRNMFLNQIKHIKVRFDSRTTREFL